MQIFTRFLPTYIYKHIKCIVFSGATASAPATGQETPPAVMPRSRTTRVQEARCRRCRRLCRRLRRYRRVHRRLRVCAGRVLAAAVTAPLLPAALPTPRSAQSGGTASVRSM